MSPVTRQKISIARALYFDSDVFLFDDVFRSMDIGSATTILKNFERLLPHKTLIISTALTSLIRPNDKVMCLYQGNAQEYGVFTDMIANPSSYIHQFMRYEPRAV
jgi:ABC-type multidrug transport system fused ATPase/permease subunit